MIRMVVVGAGRDHKVGLPFANDPDDLLAHFQRRHQLTVVVVEHFILGDSQPAGGLLRLQIPPLGQHPSTDLMVAGVAIGDGQKFDGVSGLGHFGGRSAKLDVTIVRMRADGQNTKAGRLPEGLPPAEKCRGHRGSQKRPAFHSVVLPSFLCSVEPLPGLLFLGVEGRAAQNRDHRRERGTFAHVLHVAIPDPFEELLTPS